MNDDQMMFMDGFSLQDAMAAFEIGEPRLDSGYIPPGEARPKFNPLAPLLPEELCWIIDRSFSYEMEWHKGNFMSHTVLTLLYIHHLDSIDPDLVQIPFLTHDDPHRPPEIITIVLRAAVAGLLKCCDLTWRELSKGAIQDTEDWQSDKCEIYLLEGTPVGVVASMLEEASAWVSDSPKIPYQWKNPLIARLQLRRTFLQLLETNVHRSPAQFKSYINICLEFLQQLQTHSIPEPYEDSVARLAFDPYISRRLSTAVPIRVLSTGSPAETWQAFELFFESLKETSRLAATHSVTTWKVAGLLRVWTAKTPIHQPYIRSLTQSAFYDGVLVFDNYPFVWLVDRFFYETLGITWSYFQSQVNQRWVGSAMPPFDMLEKNIYKLMIPHIRGNWTNPPRRRRHLMKALVGWHHLYDAVLEMMSYVDVSDLPPENIISAVSKAILLWRLHSIREIVFSGFRLELYAPEERTLAYWYLTQLFELELECYETFLPSIPQNTSAFREMLYNQQVTTALQSLCTSLFIMTLPLLSFNWGQTRANFFRRYKWAHQPDYERFETAPVGHPDFVEFMRACLSVMKVRCIASPREGIEFAAGLLRDLLGFRQDDGESDHIKLPQLGGWADGWIDERREAIHRTTSQHRRKPLYSPPIHQLNPSLTLLFANINVNSNPISLIQSTPTSPSITFVNLTHVLLTFSFNHIININLYIYVYNEPNGRVSYHFHNHHCRRTRYGERTGS
ncbi:N-alpha-acetyltransferase, 35 NatC auxiliary subunit [Leucoagaricus sp. SymC.cos]|nr:N-alpha-acetyltransferase, 35 NatC auxiliary subunit [Leucoagaricus sp. SymC.cos]